MDGIISDDVGPENVIKIYNHKLGLKGILVIDNTTLGPGKGGIRMTPDVTEEEVARLARTMTWKNALAGIPFGGAKAGIVWDRERSEKEKMAAIQHFAKELKPLMPKKYIAGPDVGTGEKEMAWFVGANGIWKSATGKPANLCMQLFGKKGEKCGIPHEFGSTGWGVAQATKTVVDILNEDISKATVAIHGFGNVGTFAYTFLTEMGVKVVAIADKDGAMYSENGFDPATTAEIIKQRKSISEYGNGAQKITSEDFWKTPVDILIPASVTDVINESNKKDIKAKIIVEAGNIPMQENIEDEFFKKGVVIVPDFVANAGGVISSYAEYRGYNPKQMFDTVKEKVVKTTRLVMQKSIEEKINPRQVAMELAKNRVAKGKI